jgi:hypothetical protein
MHNTSYVSEIMKECIWMCSMYQRSVHLSALDYEAAVRYRPRMFPQEYYKADD